jgi:hypothetical protein
MNGDIMSPSPRYNPGASPGTPAPAAPDPSPAPTMVQPRRRGGFLRKLLFLVLIAAIAGGVYYWQQQNVTKLQKQLADAKATNNTQASQIYNLQQQALANQKAQDQQSLAVKEWGVKVPLASATNDMSYTLATFNTKANAQASFRTKQLDTMFPKCTTDSVVMVRGLASDTFSGTGATAKTFKQQNDTLLADKNADWTKNVKPQLIGTYYYIQGQSGAACATKAADVTQENQILQAIKDALNKMAAA